MAHPVESDAARSPSNMSGLVDQPLRPTCHLGSNILNRTTIPPPLMTYKHIPSMTITSSNSRFSRIARLTSTPPIRSKLSVLFFDSSDVDRGNAKSPCSSCESSDGELDSPSRKPPLRKPTVSRLSFPFVKSTKSPSPSKCVKPTSLTSNTPPTTSPTQCTGFPASPPSPSPFSYHPHCNSQPRNYRHHGYSRHAHAHIKWFWAMREEDWEVKCGPVRKNKPKLEASFLETALDDPLVSFSCQKRKMPMHPVHQPQHALPPMTIHPRRGDLSALRDPYCTEIDRSFAGLPVWTIGKTLWMYDVHLASLDRARADADSHDVLDAYETESESEFLDTAASVVSSDDSDMTLVDSETEGEVVYGENNNIGTLRDQDVGEKCFLLARDSYSSSSSSLRRAPARSLSDTSLVLSCPHQTSWPQSAYSQPSTPSATSGSGKPLTRQSSWPTDWYQRWECMIEVSHRGQTTDGKRKFYLSHEPEDDFN